MNLSNIHRFLLAAALSVISMQIQAVANPFDEFSGSDVAALSNFQKVYIAPVEVDLSEMKFRRNIRDINSDRAISEPDRARRAKDSYKHMVRAFGKKFEVVDTPGTDVLTIETTITRMVSTRPTLEDRKLNVQLDFRSVYAGGADFKVRLSQGDTVFAELEDRHQTFLNDGFPRVGVWQDYNYISRRFASKLARYISKQ